MEGDTSCRQKNDWIVHANTVQVNINKLLLSRMQIDVDVLHRPVVVVVVVSVIIRLVQTHFYIRTEKQQQSNVKMQTAQAAERSSKKAARRQRPKKTIIPTAKPKSKQITRQDT